MAYITKFESKKEKEELIYDLKNIPDTIKISNIENFKIGNFIISKKENGYISGKISVRRNFDDFNFSLDEDFEIDKKPKPSSIYDEIVFVIFPDLKIISFNSKARARLFGMRILSEVLFGEEDKIKGLMFNPQSILEAKQEGQFKNVWFNGVRSIGKIQYTGQFGTEIDGDNDFLEDSDNRIGIGVVIDSKSGKKLKIAIYEEGTLLCHTKLNDKKEDLMMEKEIIKEFLPYSNYSEEIKETLVDEFSTLEKWI